MRLNKKRNRKALLFLLVFALAFSCGCGKKKAKTNQGAADSVLRDKGLEVISMMNQMVNSEAYRNMVGVSSDVEKVIVDIQTGDYEKLLGVYEITFNDGYFAYLSETENGKLQDLSSEGLQLYTKQKMRNSLAQLLNNRVVGVYGLAASSMFTVSKTFVCEDFSQDTTFLYIYESGYPIMLSYVGGDDHTVTATGQFLLSDSFHKKSAEEVKNQLMSQYFMNDISVREVQQSGKK